MMTLTTTVQMQLAGKTSAKSEGRSRSSTGLGLASPHASVGLLCTGLIAVGYFSRGEMDLSPSDGLGYWLGIAGLAAMTLLLGYSIRKRIKLLRGAGPMRTWFEVHLVLGLIGPTAILYHSGFELGSMNSTISLACVLAVSGSGVGGRFLYGRMHRSLGGARKTVDSHFKQAGVVLKPIESLFERIPLAADHLKEFASYASQEPSFLSLPLRAISIRLFGWNKKRIVLHTIRKSTRPRAIPAEVEEMISEYFRNLSRGAELRFFEKLFALWHAIHVPLTVILFISAAIHVVAVHLY